MSFKSAQIGTSILLTEMVYSITTQTATVTTASITKRATVEVFTILATNMSLTRENAVGARMATIQHVLIKMTKPIRLGTLAHSNIFRMQPLGNPHFARNSIGVKHINSKLLETVVFAAEGKPLEWTISDSLRMSK